MAILMDGLSRDVGRDVGKDVGNRGGGVKIPQFSDRESKKDSIPAILALDEIAPGSSTWDGCPEKIMDSLTSRLYFFK